MSIPILTEIPKYIVGVDLGQSNDFTSVLVISPDESVEPVYNLGHIERVPLQTRYPAIVSHIGKVVNALRRPVDAHMLVVHGHTITAVRQVVPEVALVVDYTGVGRPVADMLVDADLDCNLVLVTITGGNTVTQSEDGEYRVPKRDLASVIQRLLQEGRLKMPANHPMAETLTTELTGFRVKINLRGHDSYGAGEDWRSAPHDDLVLGLALACWFAESNGRQVDEVISYADPVSISPY